MIGKREVSGIGSLSIVWIPGIELMLSDLVARTLTYWTFCLLPAFSFCLFLPSPPPFFMVVGTEPRASRAMLDSIQQ